MGATRFAADATLVEAEKYLRSSEEFVAQDREATTAGDPDISIELPLQQVFGADYRHRIHGVRRTGSKNKPPETRPEASNPPRPTSPMEPLPQLPKGRDRRIATHHHVPAPQGLTTHDPDIETFLKYSGRKMNVNALFAGWEEAFVNDMAGLRIDGIQESFRRASPKA